MDTFESEKQYFERQPVKQLKNRGDALSGGCVSFDLGCRILEEFQFVMGPVRETKGKRTTIINPRSDKAMEKHSSSMGLGGWGRLMLSKW